MTAIFDADFAKRFPGGPLVEAKLSFEVSHFGVTVVFGPSGAGKTTVLRCIAGLEKPDTGRILHGGKVWFNGLTNVCHSPQRRNIGMLAQEYALLPHLTVAQNIAYGLNKLSPKARNERTAELMKLLALGGLESRYPRNISGGEQQRVALARAVARHPSLLLLDEPLSALDGPTREQLRGQLHPWLAELGVPVILVTHDLAEAMTLGDTLVVMDQGRMCQTGPVQEVVSHPTSLSVARIVGVDTIERAKVHSASNGQTAIRIGSTDLRAHVSNIRSGEVFACIRAEDVQLANGGDGAGPDDNNLPGVVREVARDGPLLRVTLDCGFPLRARVTPQAAAKLDLRPGEQKVALVAANSVHLIAVDG